MKDGVMARNKWLGSQLDDMLSLSLGMVMDYVSGYQT
jgi:hypothetical protein